MIYFVLYMYCGVVIMLCWPGAWEKFWADMDSFEKEKGVDKPIMVVLIILTFLIGVLLWPGVVVEISLKKKGD